MQDLVYEWVDFSKFSQIWVKISSNIRKFWKNWVILLKIWQKIGSNWYMNGSLFLEKLVFVWVYFQILWRHIPTKTKLEYPPGAPNRFIVDYIFKKLQRRAHRPQTSPCKVQVATTGANAPFLTSKICCSPLWKPFRREFPLPITIEENRCGKVILRRMVKNLPTLQRTGNNGRPCVHAVMCDNTYSDICMIIHGDSCFNLVKSANRYQLHMTVPRTTRAYNGTVVAKGLFIMCPSANIIRIKD